MLSVCIQYKYIASHSLQHFIELLYFWYLQDPVEGFQSSSVCWPIGPDHVDIHAFLQEAVRHAEPKVVALWVLYHRYLVKENTRDIWICLICLHEMWTPVRATVT